MNVPAEVLEKISGIFHSNLASNFLSWFAAVD
jgi:hypothetical protein